MDYSEFIDLVLSGEKKEGPTPSPTKEAQGAYVPEQEIWKPVEGYDYPSEVSNLGGVRIMDNTGATESRILKVSYCHDCRGRRYVGTNLYKGGEKKYALIHRLVADAFLPPAEKSQIYVGFKDGDPYNCRADNLLRCTRSEIRMKDGRMKEITEKWKESKDSHECREVLQYDKSGTFLKEYKDIYEACAAMGVVRTGLARTCCSDHAVCAGYQWKYKGSKKVVKPVPRILQIDEEGNVIDAFYLSKDAETVTGIKAGSIRKAAEEMKGKT